MISVQIILIRKVLSALRVSIRVLSARRRRIVLVVLLGVLLLGSVCRHALLGILLIILVLVKLVILVVHNAQLRQQTAHNVLQVLIYTIPHV